MLDLVETIGNARAPILPLKKESALGQFFAPADFRQPQLKPGRRIGIAIVDGDKQTPGLLADWIIRSETFRPAGIYRTGKSALVSLPLANPGIILLEINLPDMSGIECLRRLKPLLPDTQFIVLAASDRPDHIFSALAAGADGYLLKRTPGAELLAALHNIQRRGAALNGEIARKVLRSFQPSDFCPAFSENLSARQLEVLELLAQGKTYEQIAGLIRVGLETVNTHIRRLYKKLQVRSRSQAVALYTQAIRIEP